MKKVNDSMIKGLRWLELVIACFLFFAIILSLCVLIKDTGSSLFYTDFQLEEFMGAMLTIVVGIEFAKMLILHTPQSVIEVLLYAVARQIIISHDNAMENLIGVLAIGIIFLIRKFLFVNTFEQSLKGEDIDEG